MTLVTGPIRTGDIEATMTKGVHGPGKVVHFILEEA
jgi:L-lactate dehydrogenase complex protein LldF